MISPKMLSVVVIHAQSYYYRNTNQVLLLLFGSSTDQLVMQWNVLRNSRPRFSFSRIIGNQFVHQVGRSVVFPNEPKNVPDVDTNRSGIPGGPLVFVHESLPLAIEIDGHQFPALVHDRGSAVATDLEITQTKKK